MPRIRRDPGQRQSGKLSGIKVPRDMDRKDPEEHLPFQEFGLEFSWTRRTWLPALSQPDSSETTDHLNNTDTGTMAIHLYFDPLFHMEPMTAGSSPKIDE